MKPEKTLPTQEQSPLVHILELKLAHYGPLGVMAIQCSPVNIIAGGNAQGKSTVLDSVEALLTPARIAEPIHRGQEAAQISATFGDPATGVPEFTVERLFRGEDGDAIRIKNAKGKQIPSQRGFLNELIGTGMALDPLTFITPKPGEKPETMAKRQSEALKERCGLTEAFNKLDAEIASLMEDRKDAKAEVKRLETQLSTLPFHSNNVPDEEVNIAAESERITKCNTILAGIERGKVAVEQAEKDVETERAHVKGLHLKVEQLEEALKLAKENAVNGEATLTTYIQAHKDTAAKLEAFRQVNVNVEADLAAANTALQTAADTNKKVREKKARKELDAKLNTENAKTVSLDKSIDAKRATKLEAIKKAKLPVEGLTFDDEGLLRYNGDLLQSLSTAQGIALSCKIAMADAPKCRVLLIRDGALVGEEIKQTIYKVAGEHGYQVFVEMFTEKPIDGALMIVAGEVAGESPKTKIPTKSEPA